MGAFAIVSIVLAGVQIIQAWRLHRQRQAIRSLQDNADADHARREARYGFRDESDRVIPLIKQLATDLDIDAKAAKPVIDNLAAIMVAGRALCERLEINACKTCPSSPSSPPLGE